MLQRHNYSTPPFLQAPKNYCIVRCLITQLSTLHWTGNFHSVQCSALHR